MSGEGESKEDSKRLDSELRGKTFKVYWHLLSRGTPVGVRDIQKSLGFSSPSVAHHHLERLMELRLVDKDQYGRYLVTQVVDVGVLQAFTKVGRLMLPRYIFYAIFFTTLLGLYVFQYLPSLQLYALAFGSAGAIVSWYETIRVWRRRPI